MAGLLTPIMPQRMQEVQRRHGRVLNGIAQARRRTEFPLHWQCRRVGLYGIDRPFATVHRDTIHRSLEPASRAHRMCDYAESASRGITILVTMLDLIRAALGCDWQRLLG